MLPSSAQVGQHAKLNALSALWPTLTGAQKTSWANFAAAHQHVTAWGETKNVNGFQWFMSCNLNLATVGTAPISSAPGWSAIAAPDAFTLVANAGDFYADFGAVKNYTGYHLFVFVTTPSKQASLKLRRANFLLRYDTDPNSRYVALKVSYAAFLSVVWATFYGGTNSSIIVKLVKVQKATGLSSPYASAVIKLN